MTVDDVEDQDIELKSEQLYFDAAHEHRERQRGQLDEIPGAAIHQGAAAGLRRADRVMGQLRGPEESVAFGRIDSENADNGDGTFYVGHNAIWNEDTKDILVVNWRADVASPYYTATHKDPQGVARKRSYVCEGNSIVDFDDVVFVELAARVGALGAAEPEPDDHLLNELARNRTGEMQDIVRTIQAAQFEIVRATFDQLLIVQGGPGTGKTAVALHRVSWLLYNKAGLGAQDVLVVGPNPTFVRYVRSVLPSLGDRNVRHTDVAELGAVRVRLGRDEEPAVTRLKGDPRMAGLLDRGLQQRIRVPTEDVTIRSGGSSVTLTSEELAAIIDRLRNRPYAAGRVGLRDQLRVLARGAASDAIESVLDRIWPNLTAAQFVQDLLGSQNRLLEAAGDEFSARDVQTLYRQAGQKVTDETWSTADVALLDHVHNRISDQAGDRYGHVVIDEAQDLSPMQLAMIARRSSTGSMTVLGDIAQSTGAWARDDWSTVIEVLRRGGVPTNVEELEVGYRVPRPAFELAVKVLADAAPGVRIPRVVRDGPEPTLIETTDADRADSTVAAARTFAGDGHLVGVIFPDALRGATLAAFKSAGVRVSEAHRGGLGAAITIVSPIEAKGLEFDAVVVVEPTAVAAGDVHGPRQLYIAFTRTTGHLAVVHTEPFLDQSEDATIFTDVQDEVDEADTAPADAAGRSRTSTESASLPGEPVRLPLADPATQAIARHLAEQIRSVVREDQIESILRAIVDELEER